MYTCIYIDKYTYMCKCVERERERGVVYAHCMPGAGTGTSIAILSRTSLALTHRVVLDLNRISI